jgi:hypothetical protein
VEPRLRPELAISRLSQLYTALPRRFPRVKLIDWFDCNNLRHARRDRQLNNYSLTENSGILGAYRRAVATDYFLANPEARPEATIRPLRQEERLSGVVTLSAWVRAPIDRPRVYLAADEEVLYAGNEPGPCLCRWDTRNASPGPHTLRLVLTDGAGRWLREERRKVWVGAVGLADARNDAKGRRP